MFRTLFVAALPLALAACSAAGRPDQFLSDSSPADPTQGIRNLHYRSVLDGYTHRVAVEPKPWRQQNDSQAPGAGTGS